MIKKPSRLLPSMKRLVTLIGLATSAVIPASAQAEDVHWAYEDPHGPEHWKEEFPACGGNSQSPIDIRETKQASGAGIHVDYKPSSPVRIVNNGHTIQVNYAPGSSITVSSTMYELVQFHFHRPSEEQIQGRSFDLSAHLVHRNRNGKLAVIAVLFREGRTHPLLAKVWAHLPIPIGPERTIPGLSVDASELLPAVGGYYRYSGSLTTPPCTEGVTWLVMQVVQELSGDQLRVFPFKRDARPIQPLNGRIVEEFTTH